VILTATLTPAIKLWAFHNSLKFEHKYQSWEVENVISYILDCSYKEAYEILTKKWGKSSSYTRTAGKSMVVGDMAFHDYIWAHPNYVVFQDCVDWGIYNLTTDTGTISSTGKIMNIGIDDGRSWNKGEEIEGSLRITGIPELYDGGDLWIQVIDFLDGKPAEFGDNWSNRRPHKLVFQKNNGFFAGPKISNGTVNFQGLVWFPSNRYDRKNGTYKNGTRYGIVVYASDGKDRRLEFYPPVITFINGHAELDFNTFEGGKKRW